MSTETAQTADAPKGGGHATPALPPATGDSRGTKAPPTAS